MGLLSTGPQGLGRYLVVGVVGAEVAQRPAAVLLHHCGILVRTHAGEHGLGPEALRDLQGRST